MFYTDYVNAQTLIYPAIGMRMTTVYDPRVNIVEEQRFMGLHKDGMRSPLLKNTLGKKRTVEIDTTGQNINFTEKLGDFDIMLANYLSLEDYIQSRRDYKINDAWIQTTVSKLTETTTTGGGGGFRIDIPVEIKSKAFQKIFGTGTVGLDVSGEINIKGGFRNEKRSEAKTALNRGSDNNFKMEQTQRFQVQGRIGDKVKIGIDQDSERTFDFDNNISLKYEGYEDEVIQSIEAGNIALSLPGTQFVTFGGKSNGLFGIKTAATIGNLKLTAIASQEKGEKKKLSLKGGASEEASRIEDTQYKRGIYFFIDEYYRENYINRTADGNLTYEPGREIVQYELYKAGPGYQQRYTESIHGWAFVPSEYDTLDYITEVDTTKERRNLVKGYYIRMEKNVDYDIDERLGYIRLRQRLGDDEVLAIAYKDADGRQRGSLDVDTETKLLYLRMLKNTSPRPADKTWDLEWKNVYDFGRGTPKDGFEMRIFFKPASGDPQETTEVGGVKKTWLEFFGLDKKDLNGASTPDNLVDDNPALINFSTGEVFFPDLRPFDPVGDNFSKIYPADLLAPALYDTTVQAVINAQSHFYIEVNSKRASSQYSLGMNVIENSEEVTLNGSRLKSGTDYTIDYFSGQLRILNENALAANANLEISYESNQLFQIDKKTVMGARAEYGLWGDSFIGATFLYLNERTLDQKVRVGKGPMRNMVWDVNTSLSAEPYFLTRMANLLPFVDSRANSTIKFEGEFAQIIPNPNTRNNEYTGDNDGVAYIDDFEATKRETPIGIVHQSWEYCSPPVGKYQYEPKDNRTLLNRAGMFYFTPYTPYPINQIWPNRDLNANVNQTTNILVMEFTPVDTIPGVDVKDTWNGIQKWLSSGFSNQTETKYIEIWVAGDSSGTMHIDLGQISEDIIPNGKYDTEDKLIDGMRNGLLDDNEDIGLDGMGDKDSRATAAGGDFWDLNNNGVKEAGEPFSSDNYSYNVQLAENDPKKYRRVNGTENNKDSGGLRVPDTEDLNGNGDVDMSNNYFEYSFSLKRDHADTMYIAGKSISKKTGEDFHWRQYRIPINAPDNILKKIGSPDLSLIEYIRVWVDGFETPGLHSVWIAEINLVSSDWKEMGISSPAKPDSFIVDNDSTVTITVINTHDNPEYKAPPGVQGEVDRITQVIAREQSLVLKVDKLMPGYSGIIEKTFYEAQDYINYRTLKMFVYGKDTFGRHITRDSSKVEFFLRMGSDRNNYYEIRQPVYEGWKNNNVEVDLIALSQMKVSSDSTWFDPENPAIKILYKDLGNGKSWLVKGKPALRNIRMLIAGVKNKGYDDLEGTTEALQEFTGEVWLNEMRLSNVKKDKGIALRSRLDFGLADLIRFNGELNKMDADFHNVAQRFGTGDNEVSGSFSTSVNVEKFLPPQLGLSLPVSVNYSKSESTPKYIPGTDIEVTDDLPEATLDSIRSIDEKRGMNVSFGINSRSQNFLVKHLLTKLKASYSRNESEGSDSRTQFRTSMSESGSLTWGLAFGTNTFIKPFKWIGTNRFLLKLSDMKLYYAPQTLTTAHSGARSINESMTRTGVSSSNRSFILNRSYGIGMKITETLSYDIKRSYVHDVRGINSDLLQEELKENRIGLLTSIDNSLSLKYSPQIFSWFTPNLTYTTGFKYGFNRQQTLAPRSATQNRTFQGSVNLNIATLFKAVYRPGASKGPKAGGAPPGRTAPGAVPGAAQTGTQQKSGSKFNFSTMGILSGFFNAFEPFSVSYNTRDNIAKYGIKGMPSNSFQYGFTQDPGVGIEEAVSGGAAANSSASFDRGSSSINNTTSVSSGINISRNVSIRLKYDDSYSLNANGKTTTGQRSKSWMKIGETAMVFPGWTASVRSLEKLPYVSKYFQRVTLDHNFSGRANETFEMVKTGNIEKEHVTKEDKDSSFRPLIGLTMSMKNGISMSVRYNKSFKEATNTSYSKSIQRNISNDLSITANYSKRSDFRIPLPFLRNKKLKNNVDIALTFSTGLTKQEDSKDGKNFQVKAETTKWMFKPDISYSFSERVKGGMFFEIGKTSNKMTGETKYKEFGLNVNIQIRGN
ncbi:MAG TPA: cell surface protein SprA [bacterium]|nr:cell surface protein SprA [bacterium]HPN44278.1 cell surface protein SprA [bacterium]